jgi:hypothetical protein
MIKPGDNKIVVETGVAGPPESRVPAWEPMPRETPRAYEAAWTYFKMGSSRSQSAVAEELGKRLSQMQRWSTRWDWVRRAAAYDDHLATVARKAIEKQASEDAAKWRRRAEEHREKKFLRGEKLENKADQMLAFPLATVTTEGGKMTVRPARWNLRDAAVLSAGGSRMKEEAIKETTEEAVGKTDEEFEENWLIDDYNKKE